MGRVIDLEAWRRRRDGPSDEDAGGSEGEPIERLERAIERLDGLVAGRAERLGPRLERELLAITGCVSAGRVEEAAHRARRLAELLEHPSSRLAR